MRIYSKNGFIFFDADFDLNENISVIKTIESDNSFNFTSTKLGTFNVLFSNIDDVHGLPYSSENTFEQIFLNGINLKSSFKNTLMFMGS